MEEKKQKNKQNADPKKAKKVEVKDTEQKKVIMKKDSKKTEASVEGKDLPCSTKYAVAVCNFIRGKNIDKAIQNLEKVSKKKIAIPMKGEIPHKRGIMSGRYPINTSTIVIKLLKSLKANAIANELELEKTKIFCKANIASRPYRRFGKGRFKRTHITIKLIPLTKK
jgi:ribosomal protein L22